MIDYDTLTEKIRDYTEAHVKPARYDHCVRVAEMCVKLCRRYGLDENKGYLVGIGHDMCKDMPRDKMVETALRDGNPITDFEKTKLSLLHGRAAAVMMKEKFGITDNDILEAVANHVSGKVGLCDLGKVLFLADKTEPGRPQSTDEYRANLMKLTLDQMFLSVIKENYEFIKNKGYEIYPDTLKMIEYCERAIREPQESQV
ncbi:MAG: bis(5'-nucleosyl)-tetraphosphatase (symmetrical) YqeK [Treponema sp.]|nr:bis(5'-nucleosyl)-tetraphosphatase (symmetrical) YqeK [Treponema sp.]